MALQPYMGGEANALVAYQAPEITQEERERRLKEAEVLEEKLKFINEKLPTRVLNVSGSNAGAGSGDFHQYRMARRRELARQQRIEEQWEEDQKVKEFEDRQAQLKAEDEARTAKRRAKRQKQKAKKKVKGANGGSVGEDGDKGEQDSDSDGAPPGEAALD